MYCTPFVVVGVDGFGESAGGGRCGSIFAMMSSFTAASSAPDAIAAPTRGATVAERKVPATAPTAPAARRAQGFVDTKRVSTVVAIPAASPAIGASATSM